MRITLSNRDQLRMIAVTSGSLCGLLVDVGRPTRMPRASVVKLSVKLRGKVRVGSRRSLRIASTVLAEGILMG